MNQPPKDLLELPMFHSLAQMLRSDKLMHQCQICGEYNFETEMFDDPSLGWVDNACLDAYVDDACERWEYEEDLIDPTVIATFDGERR